MYSSLHKIDVTASTPNGPLYVQTDHRSADEIAAEPEISTLFALTRILLARAYGAKQPGPAPTISPTAQRDKADIAGLLGDRVRIDRRGPRLSHRGACIRRRAAHRR